METAGPGSGQHQTFHLSLPEASSRPVFPPRPPVRVANQALSGPCPLCRALGTSELPCCSGTVSLPCQGCQDLNSTHTAPPLNTPPRPPPNECAETLCPSFNASCHQACDQDGASPVSPRGRPAVVHHRGPPLQGLFREFQERRCHVLSDHGGYRPGRKPGARGVCGGHTAPPPALPPPAQGWGSAPAPTAHPLQRNGD